VTGTTRRAKTIFEFMQSYAIIDTVCLMRRVVVG
jgi:hypothetical protein